MNEFLQQFLSEGRELVEQATNDLLALEREPSDRENLDSAFRAFHTLKGGAGIVGFGAMSRATHAAEDILSGVRSGERPITATLIGDCLACVDQVVQWLDTIQDSGELPANADADADRIIARFTEGEKNPASALGGPVDAPALAAGALAAAVLNEQLALLAVRGEGAEGRFASAARLSTNVLRSMGRANESGEINRAFSESRERGDPAPLSSAIQHAVALLSAPSSVEVFQPPRRTDPLSRTLRVDAQRIDALVNLTGELTIAKNAVGHIAKLAQQSDNVLAAPIRDQHEKLDRLIASMQRAVLGLRVMAVRSVFERFSRLVREMSTQLAKPVHLEAVGGETEADRAIVEMLFEPLIHVVRNALDHGIEAASEREALGKPAIATIRLRAWREGEHVIVEVEDDGRGINAAQIRDIAKERGLVALDVLSAMSDAEAVDLVFNPGFSTAAEITGLSGRGVGMDAVRRAVERIGGRVLLETHAGSGTTVRFVLPFSIMLTRVMTVEAGGQSFGIPLDAVVETVRIQRRQIRPVGGAHAFVLRNRTIPVVDLARTLGQRSGSLGAEATLVVTLVGGQLGAMEVDRLGERMDVMLKAPEGLLSNVPGIGGTTMLGDGSVLLILDLQQLLL